MGISPGPAQKEVTDQAIQSCDPLNNAHIFLPLPLIGATPLEGDLDPFRQPCLVLRFVNMLTMRMGMKLHS
jgi:hypothetical protein